MSTGYVCPECGLDYDTVQPPDAKLAIQSYPRRYREAVAGALEDESDEGLIRRRPEPAVWSALEYCAHVADVLREFTGIVRRMRTEDQPALPFFDPDERAEKERYNDQAPEEVLARLSSAAESLAGEVGKIGNESWGRTATFPWGERDLLMMVRNAVHEGSHHLRDVNSVLEAARRLRPA